MKKIVVILFYLLISISISAQIDTLKSDTVFQEYFYPNGKISSHGNMINHKPGGLWKSYYVSGVKKSEGLWKNGLLDSIWIFYTEVGDTSEKINYYLGKKNGYTIKYFTSTDNKNVIQSKELYLNGKRNGKSYYYYESGEVHKIIFYHNDVKNGLAYEFDCDSNIISITRYRNNQVILHEEINRYNDAGEQTGLWKEFYDNGHLKEEKNYINGKLDGVYKIYNENGFLIQSVHYKNGEIVDSTNDFESDINIKEDYDENGNLIFLGSFLNQKPIGVHRFFDENGSVIQSKTYNVYHELIAEGIVKLNGNKDGSWTYYYPDQKIEAKGFYQNGEKSGKWIFYFRNGKVEQTGSYINGKLSGNWKWFYNNGELRKEEFYIYGLADGESYEYSDSGKIIAKGNYVQGEKEGVWIYDIGDETETGKYVMGLKDGIWRRYYKSNGSIAFTGKFVQGSPDEKHTYYYPNGNVKEEQYYDTGQKIKSWAKYNVEGELILVVQYRNNEIYKINGVKMDFANNDD